MNFHSSYFSALSLLAAMAFTGCPPHDTVFAPEESVPAPTSAPTPMLPESAFTPPPKANDVADKPAGNQDAIDNIQLTADSNQLLGNTTLTDLYSDFGRWVPKCTTLYDYPASAGFMPRAHLLAITIRFPSDAVFKNLPQTMLAQLYAYNVDSKNLDVFFHAQLNDFSLGESEDHTDKSTWTTRLRPHGWADPNVPLHFQGSRVNRDFLVGLFDVDDIAMQDEVVVDQVKPFNLNVHDSMSSPRNMRIKLPGKSYDTTKQRGQRFVSSTQAFWSLVIDTQVTDTDGRSRAVATLHWLIGDLETFGATSAAYTNDLIDMIPVVGAVDATTTPLFHPKFAKWRELFTYFKTNPKIASQSIVRKLVTLSTQNKKHDRS